MYQENPTKNVSPAKYLQIVNRLFASFYHLPLDYFLENLCESLGLEKAAVYFNRLDYRWQLVASLVAQHLAKPSSPFPDVLEYQEIWPGLETKLSEGERVMLTRAEIEALGFLDETDHHLFVFPILEDKWWNGALLVDFGQRNPSAEELALLDEFVNALSLAIKRQKRESEYLDINRVFQELLNNIPYVVILVDSQGRWLLANKKSLELFNLKRKSIYQGQTFDQLSQIRPQYQALFEKLKSLLPKAPLREASLKETFKLKHKEQVQWWEFLLIPFRCDSEKRILILGKDITSFKLAQERLLAILENLPAMVYIVQPESRKILYGNALFKQYFGERVVNQAPCHKLLYGKDNVCDFCHLKSPSTDIHQEKEVFDSQRSRWLKLYETYIPWFEKDLVRLGMIQDVTEYKKQEEELIRSQKMELLGKMTGSVAHEFNNILAVINGYLDLIRLRSQEDQKINQYITKIQQAVEAGTNLVKQLLILSRGKADDKKQIADLNRAVTEQKELFQKLLGEKIQLEIDLCPEPLPVNLSYEEIQHILTNLVLNARDAMPEGGLVKITTRRVETSKGQAALLRVEDTGCGIPKDKLAHIFEPFYTTKPFGEGTGLGLNVILSLVRKNGGEIKVESEPGRGTSFEIILPLQIKESVVTGEKDFSPARDKEGKESSMSKPLILVVEDEPHIREMLAEMLEGQGFQVVSAANGQEALEWLKEHNFSVDLIITDVVMPKMDGVQLFRELQKFAPQIPMIFISGYAEHILEKYGVDETSFKIIKKPFTFSQILGEIRKLLGD